MLLRALIYLQIIWIATTGLMFRGLLDYPETRLIDVFVIAAIYGFPAGIGAAVTTSSLTKSRKWCILFLEAGLTIAYFIAILPGAQ